MKAPEEYLDYYFDFADVRKSDLIQMIDEIKKDSYNQAIEDVMMNARVKKMFLSTGDYSGYDKYIIDKDSILKLKIK